MLKLYNTATRRVEEFRQLGAAGTPVKIYTCGPTVYNFPHIGNFAAYTYWDLLVRTLKADGYAVKRVLNLTDVGHLTSDGDEGEDKLEKSAAREGKTPEEIADFYAGVYLRDYAKLEFLPPEVTARATAYIAEDMAEVDKMTARGFTYETRDGIYFDTAKFPDYAKFARLDLAGLQAGKRVEFSAEKRNAADFAVWKFIQPGEKHAMRWDYRGRPGYPGWHLECSTIIHAELGEPIDIHAGGVDHIPVHHTNEIAQTYAAEGRELARYWLHCDFITIDGQKISKSLGNTYTLEDLEARGFTAMDFKMWLLSGHYQGTRNFTFEALEAAKQRRRNWRAKVARCYQEAGGTKRGKAAGAAGAAGASKAERGEKKGFAAVLAAVNNNLNSAEACKVIDGAELSLADWRRVDELFGLRLIADTPDVAAEVYARLRERDAARAAKDFAAADRIRAELAERGIGVKDEVGGGVWEYLA